MLVFAWVVVGWASAFGTWWMYTYDFWREERQCLTPRAIALILILGCVGGFGLVLVLVGTFIGWVVMYFGERPRNPDSWWTRPICKRKD